MQKLKTVQYFFDARTYSKNQIIENLQTQREQDFFNKTAKINISLNEFGVYVVTYYFKVSENIFQKIFIKIKQRRKDKKIRLLQEKNGNLEERKKDKIEKRLEKYSGNKYGEYKSSGIYKPY